MTNEKTFEQRLSEAALEKYPHEQNPKDAIDSQRNSNHKQDREAYISGANWCKAEMQQEIDDLKAQYMAVIDEMKNSLDRIKSHDACVNCLEFGYIKQGEHETDSPQFISKQTLANIEEKLK